MALIEAELGKQHRIAGELVEPAEQRFYAVSYHQKDIEIVGVVT